jgi:hypothetical protein
MWEIIIAAGVAGTAVAIAMAAITGAALHRAIVECEEHWQAQICDAERRCAKAERTLMNYMRRKSESVAKGNRTRAERNRDLVAKTTAEVQEANAVRASDQAE